MVIYCWVINVLINNNYFDVVLFLIDFNIIYLCYIVYVMDDILIYYIIWNVLLYYLCRIGNIIYFVFLFYIFWKSKDCIKNGFKIICK